MQMVDHLIYATLPNPTLKFHSYLKQCGYYIIFK